MLCGHIWKGSMSDEESPTMRIPPEFDVWITNIMEEFEKKRGFKPSRADILKNIVKQFKGQFIV